MAFANQTSYSNSFAIQVTPNGFFWIPRMPSSIVINEALYQRIFEIANVSLYPLYTLLKQNSMYITPCDTDDIHVERALYFPWVEGIPKRLDYMDCKDILNESSNRDHKIPLMQNLVVDYDKVTSIAIAGSSGSGKSYFLGWWLRQINRFSKLVIIDPKMDSPSRWARDNHCKAIYPNATRSKDDFVTQVNDELSTALSIIYARQRQLYSNPNLTFTHLTIVIEELLALTESVSKNVKDAFFSLISQVSLLGRATSVHLLLVSQRFDFHATPLAVREQLNVLAQMGNINSKTTQFLFPDLDPSGIVIPLGKGTGLIQVLDSDHPPQVQPFLAPTYTCNRKENTNEKRSY